MKDHRHLNYRTNQFRHEWTNKCLLQEFCFVQGFLWMFQIKLRKDSAEFKFGLSYIWYRMRLSIQKMLLFDIYRERLVQLQIISVISDVSHNTNFFVFPLQFHQSLGVSSPCETSQNGVKYMQIPIQLNTSMILFAYAKPPEKNKLDIIPHRNSTIASNQMRIFQEVIDWKLAYQYLFKTGSISIL